MSDGRDLGSTAQQSLGVVQDRLRSKSLPGSEPCEELRSILGLEGERPFADVELVDDAQVDELTKLRRVEADKHAESVLAILGRRGPHTGVADVRTKEVPGVVHDASSNAGGAAPERPTVDRLLSTEVLPEEAVCLLVGCGPRDGGLPREPPAGVIALGDVDRVRNSYGLWDLAAEELLDVAEELRFVSPS